MPTIKFTATPKLPSDLSHLGYVAGMEITADKDWCDKWVNRRVAEYVAEQAAVAAEVIASTAGEVDHAPVIEADEKPDVEATVPMPADPLPVEAPRRARKPRAAAND